MTRLTDQNTSQDTKDEAGKVNARNNPELVSARDTPVVRSSDVQLASFPRSGNTWMMNILLRGGVMALTPEAFRASAVFPAHLLPHAGLLKQSVAALQNRWDTGPLRVIKTHELPRIWSRKAIYVYRDGRDVITSFFFYLKSRGQIPEQLSFSRFLWEDMSTRSAWASQIGDPDFMGKGPAALWAKHVNYWFASKRFMNLFFIRYEDLLADPLPILKKMFSFLGVERTDEYLEKIIEETRFEKLQKTEPVKGMKSADGNNRFFRSGTKGNWHKHFTDVDVEKFKEQGGQTLIELGYEEDLKWRL